MGYDRDYPNVWKDGRSSTDHLTAFDEVTITNRSGQDARDMAVAAAAQQRMREREAQERMKKPQQVTQSDSYYDRHKEERYAQQEMEQAQRRQSIRREKERQLVNQMVDERRNNYNKKSWLGKLTATLSGKSFNQQQRKIYDEAKLTVSQMNERDIDRQLDQGRSR